MQVSDPSRAEERRSQEHPVEATHKPQIVVIGCPQRPMQN